MILSRFNHGLTTQGVRVNLDAEQAIIPCVTNGKEQEGKIAKGFQVSGTRLNHRHFAFYPHPMHMREELVDFDRQVFDLGDFFCFSFRKLVIGYEPR